MKHSANLVTIQLTVVVALFTACQGQMQQAPGNNPGSPAANQSVAQQPLMVPVVPSPTISPSPSPSLSASPSASPTPKKTEAARTALSTNPVSTSSNKRGPVTIRLTDGSTINADEAWETKEGIWYRRRGLVTLLKRDQVKGFENRKPAPSPKPSPVASP